MSVIKISRDNFEEKVIKSEMPVLLDFYADWCGPCKMIAPILSEIAEERDDIVVGKVNVDDNMELAQKFGVTSIPMLAVIKNGQVVRSEVGAIPKAAILDMID